jgi:hypothetical protein
MAATVVEKSGSEVEAAQARATLYQIMALYRISPSL